MGIMSYEVDFDKASTVATQETTLEWVKKEKRRMLHVVYRVGDLDRTIKFYTECLGLKLLRKRDISEERYTNVVLGYGPKDSHFLLNSLTTMELTSMTLELNLVILVLWLRMLSRLELIKTKGGKVTREPGLVKGRSIVIAFVEDPDSYKFELIERRPTHEPLCQVMLCIGDLEHSINLYEKAFGMELLRTRDNPQYKGGTVSREQVRAILDGWS